MISISKFVTERLQVQIRISKFANPGFEPATFQSQVQRSTDWATGAPQIMVHDARIAG